MKNTKKTKKNNLPKPADSKLYATVKKRIYKQHPKHSAYRSGIVVQEYKKSFKRKYGPRRKPYTGKRTIKRGLSRWFREKWVNQRGKVGYKYKSDIYRPTYRITKNTPTTHSELSRKQIKRARKEKYTKGRVKKFKQGGGSKTKKKSYRNKMFREKSGKIIFKDYPDFTPNLTPQEMFELGSFGGTYWRPIYSSVTKKNYKNVHKQYPKSWWKNVPEENLSSSVCDVSKNKYGVRVGTSLKFWEDKGWIMESHPYGWVQWYCDFYMGKRSEDDERQVKRWLALAGPRGRFMRFLVTQVLKKGDKKDWDNPDISPKIRQVLQHWGYKLTKTDFDYEIKRRENKKK